MPKHAPGAVRSASFTLAELAIMAAPLITLTYAWWMRWL